MPTAVPRVPLAPISLGESEMSAIFAAAHTLPPHKRAQFLKECSHVLASLSEVGDGRPGSRSMISAKTSQITATAAASSRSTHR